LGNVRNGERSTSKTAMEGPHPITTALLFFVIKRAPGRAALESSLRLIRG
jgi:hypothetical protein